MGNSLAICRAQGTWCNPLNGLRGIPEVAIGPACLPSSSLLIARYESRKQASRIEQFLKLASSAFGRGCVKSLALGNTFKNRPARSAGEILMTGFVTGADRMQGTMFPAQLDDYVAADNPVRVIDFFIDQLDLAKLGFGGVTPKGTGRPAYHPRGDVEDLRLRLPAQLPQPRSIEPPP